MNWQTETRSRGVFYGIRREEILVSTQAPLASIFALRIVGMGTEWPKEIDPRAGRRRRRQTGGMSEDLRREAGDRQSKGKEASIDLIARTRVRTPVGPECAAWLAVGVSRPASPKPGKQ